MKRIFIILVIAGLGTAGACSSDRNAASGRKCKVMKNGKEKEKKCEKLVRSKNYPVRGY
jgi:hypothetical protein